MNNSKVYKKLPKFNGTVDTPQQLPEADKAQMRAVVNKFFELFKAKHS